MFQQGMPLKLPKCYQLDRNSQVSSSILCSLSLQLRDSSIWVDTMKVHLWNQFLAVVSSIP